MIRDLNIKVVVRQEENKIDIKITEESEVLFERHDDKWFRPLSFTELGQEIMRAFRIALLKDLKEIETRERS